MLAVTPAPRRALRGGALDPGVVRPGGARPGAARPSAAPPRPAASPAPTRDPDRLVVRATGGRSAATSPGPGLDPDLVARRALDVGRRTALGVLAGDAATADDVAQEVAILALRHAHRLRDPSALDGWLYRTAVRAALRTVRRGRRRHVVEEAHAAVHGRTAAAPAGTVDDLGRLLAALPERQRAALTLRYAHDLDDDAIAAALGCRAGTVRALLSRGRATLRERLAAPEPTGPPASRTSAAPRTTTGEHDA